MPEKSPNHDDLLQKGLEAWAEGEPAPGLPERVLARLQREPTPALGDPRRRRPWLRHAAAALLVAVGGAVLFRGAPPRVARESPSPARTAPAGESVMVPRPAPEALEPTRIADAAAPTAKPPWRSRTPSPSIVRDVFPSPSPLGEEDRLLIAYVAATPLDEMKNHLGFLDAPAEETLGTKENR